MALKRLYTAILWTAALMLLPLLTACQWIGDDDELCEQSSGLKSNQYLNITISVASGTKPAATRAPQGGEDGDGREAGFERENAITGITLILADGSISSSTSKVAYSRYFPVTTVTPAASLPINDHNHATADIAQQYTTGNQLIERTDLDLTANKQYYIYVVANRYISVSKDDNLQTVLSDQMLTRDELFSGNAYAPDLCQNFVMTSEQENTVNFGNRTGVSTTSDANAIYFNVTKPIIIERMAARIDFCTAYINNTKNADYGTYNVNVGGTTSTVSGFKYFTGATGTDESYFILESITPFNLNKESEYLFERVTSGWTESEDVYTPATPTYLDKETATNYVVDPNTAKKKTTTLTYTNPLGTTAPDWSGNAYLRTAASLNSQTSKSKAVSNATDDNFVVAYTMENTLLPVSPLKTYATGLAITGSYYSPTGEFVARKTFYGYLRHQGELSTGSYRAYEYADLSTTATVGSTPMNFSVVRNNIYRVSIESINPLDGRLSLKLAVHDWRNVEHPTINI